MLDTQTRLMLVPIILLAFALHEMAHAYVASWFGDPTPEQHGRRTLNPIRHLDPVGSLMLVVTLLAFGFPMGFAVTPVDERKMRKPNLHGALTSLAGPGMNLLLAALSAGVLSVFVNAGASHLAMLLAYLSIYMNVFLAVFNLLPIPPLDGGHVVGNLLRGHLQREWRKLDQYGMFIIIGLVVLGGASFSMFLNSVQQHIMHVIGRVAGVDL